MKSYRLLILFLFFCPVLFGQPVEQTPANFTIAFIGDQGLGKNARAVLMLIKDEGADAVLHLGDFDYKDNPARWEAQINKILGADFPYFATVGNHDEDAWHGAKGYQRFLQDRLKRLDIAWEGDLGVQSDLHYKGIYFVLVAPGIWGDNHADFIRDKLAADNSIWSICGWHKNMKLMQAGGKSDETGWEVYEEARLGGAIIATAHEHSYSRSHLLSSIQNQTVAGTSDTLVITRGNSFVFVSGLAGKSIRDQEVAGDWWASVYTSHQNAAYGALFGIFSFNGQADVAKFYFKDIDNKIIDEFYVSSRVEEGAGTMGKTP